jgi:hypothetical protein
VFKVFNISSCLKKCLKFEILDQNKFEISDEFVLQVIAKIMFDIWKFRSRRICTTSPYLTNVWRFKFWIKTNLFLQILP